jgi:hypothetical protein
MSIINVIYLFFEQAKEHAVCKRMSGYTSKLSAYSDVLVHGAVNGAVSTTVALSLVASALSIIDLYTRGE